MLYQQSMTSHILWRSEDESIFLIDIPRSIAEAQGTPSHPCHDCIVSSESLKVPFTLNNEPKSAAAKSKLVGNSIDVSLHVEYASLLETALEEVRKHHRRPWCLPRLFHQRPSEKRKRKDDNEVARTLHQNYELPMNLLSGLARSMGGRRLRLASNSSSALTPTAELISNEGGSPAELTIEQTDGESTYRFRIPPKSSFYLADCNDAQAFRNTLRAHAHNHDHDHRFDFILLDPPWPNTSVRRTHKAAAPASTYNTISTLDEAYNLLHGMDLDMIMSKDCLLGIWITNKPAIRNLVLDEHGLFQAWGLRLVEEWIWLKTTEQGEPVTPLDALWRKPYEVLLLGRRAGYEPIDDTAGEEQRPRRRRVLLGAPDLHSRKPCLKALVEPLMPDVQDYRALEIFARYLVAGWCSWGDECTKFNWEGYWKRDATLGEGISSTTR